jgi:transposase InsO family protein
MTSPAKRKEVVIQAMENHSISERRACRIFEQSRATQRRTPVERSDEDVLTQRIIALACNFGRYGYRRIAALLRMEGFRVNHKRVERIWRASGLKIPQKQRKRGRLWLNDGSCIRLRPAFANHVWSYDFVADRTSDGKAIRFLNIIDEYTRECLFIKAARSLKARDVSDVLFYLFNTRGMPCYIRSDNGSEFIEKELRAWFAKIGVRTTFIEPGSPWENGYIESFNGKMRDEFLNAEQLDTLNEAQVLAERWRMQYNHIRPHSSRGYLPPAPESFLFWEYLCNIA